MKSKEKKQAEAQERQQEREQRSAQEQLAVLDARLGKGVGANKEREKLRQLIEEE